MKNKPTNKSGVFSSLLKLITYVPGLKGAFILVFCFSILSTVFSVIGPKITGVAINELVAGIGRKISGAGGIDFSVIGKLLIVLLILYVASCLFIFIQSYIVTDVTQKICFAIRKDLSKKINRMPIAYL